MKNKIIAALTVCFLLMSFACSNENSNSSKEKVTLEFWTWRTEDVEFYEKVIKAFEKEHPNITVKQTAIKNTEYNTDRKSVV